MRGRTAVSAAAASMVLATLAGPVPAVADTGHAVLVTGAVTAPATYSVGQLAALPQVTYPVVTSGWPRSVTGVDLEGLVERSTPVLPAGKNTQLRVTLTVTAHHRSVTFALGELDPPSAIILPC